MRGIIIIIFRQLYNSELFTKVLMAGIIIRFAALQLLTHTEKSKMSIETPSAIYHITINT